MRSPRSLFSWIGVFACALMLTAQTAPFRYSQQPVVMVPNIDNVVLANVQMTHYWEFTDTGGGTTPQPCQTQLADAIINGSTPVPSPVPVNCSSPTASPFPFLGDPGIVKDGSNSIEFTNGVSGFQGQWLTPASVGILSNLCNGNAGGSCVDAFSIGCVVDANELTGPSYFFSADGTTTGLAIGASFSSGMILNDRGSLLNSFVEFGSGVPYIVEYTFNPTGNISDLYVNGVLAEATSSPIPQVSPNSVTYFGSETGSAGGWNGRIHKCWTANDTESAAAARALFTATGFF